MTNAAVDKQLHTGLARLTLFHNFQQFVFSVSLLDISTEL